MNLKNNNKKMKIFKHFSLFVVYLGLVIVISKTVQQIWYTDVLYVGYIILDIGISFLLFYEFLCTSILLTKFVINSKHHKNTNKEEIESLKKELERIKNNN